MIEGLEWAPLNCQLNQALERPFEEEEIYRAIKDLGNSKSPGLDGMMG